MQNLEIKARCPNHRRAERLVREHCRVESCGRLVQTDTYFQVPQGRLKLRQIRSGEAGRSVALTQHELIFYHRPNQATPRSSLYEILPLADGPAGLDFFTKAFGVKVRVHKIRRDLLWENVRLHLDLVRGLGRFLEVEIIVSRAHPLAACRGQMNELMRILQIAAKDLVSESYSDLLS